ncbi:MAG: DUF503 domain-containing protein [bacterium]
MLTGVLFISILLTESYTIKDRRQIVKSIKDRIKHRFNVSIVEADNQNKLSRADFGFSIIANREDDIVKTFDKIQKFIVESYPVEIIERKMSII